MVFQEDAFRLRQFFAAAVDVGLALGIVKRRIENRVAVFALIVAAAGTEQVEEI